jgi:microcystin-dependent protein
LLLSLTASVAAAQGADGGFVLPHVFAPNTPAFADQVNANFAALAARANFTVPAGGIIMWSGQMVPPGWALCNGAAGTPDLRDRFIVGSGGQYQIHADGGTATVTLTTAQMPAHSHSIPDGGDHNHALAYDFNIGGSVSGFSFTATPTAISASLDVATVTTANGAHDHGGSTGLTGGGQAQENRPPYYALAFIMKLP